MVTEAPIGGGTGSGGTAAPPVARWLGLAAAPTFAMMALWSALFGAHPDMLCTGMRGSSALNGMALMYLLMSVFHASPWLRVAAPASRGFRRFPTAGVADGWRARGARSSS